MAFRVVKVRYGERNRNALSPAENAVRHARIKAARDDGVVLGACLLHCGVPDKDIGLRTCRRGFGWHRRLGVGLQRRDFRPLLLHECRQLI